MKIIKNSLMLITGFISLNAFCQTIFEIDNFSPKYKGVVTIADGYEDEIFKKGIVSVTTSSYNIYLQMLKGLKCSTAFSELS